MERNSKLRPSSLSSFLQALLDEGMSRRNVGWWSGVALLSQWFLTISPFGQMEVGVGENAAGGKLRAFS